MVSRDSAFDEPYVAERWSYLGRSAQTIVERRGRYRPGSVDRFILVDDIPKLESFRFVEPVDLDWILFFTRSVS